MPETGYASVNSMLEVYHVRAAYRLRMIAESHLALDRLDSAVDCLRAAAAHERAAHLILRGDQRPVEKSQCPR